MAYINKIKVSGTDHNISAPYEVIENWKSVCNIVQEENSISFEIHFNKENYDYNNKYVVIDLTTEDLTNSEEVIIYCNHKTNFKYYIKPLSEEQGNILQINCQGGRKITYTQPIKNAIVAIDEAGIVNFEGQYDVNMINIPYLDSMGYISSSIRATFDEIGVVQYDIMDDYEM